MVDVEKKHIDTVEHVNDEAPPDEDSLPNPEHESVPITAKTWLVIWLMSASFLLSFWVVPTTAAMQARLATSFGDANAGAWWLPSYTLTLAISFLLFGANSDLFGRRWFILVGNITVGIGQVICATSHSANQFLAGMVIVGFGAGNSQLALCAIPELLPNKFRHIGIVIADGLSFFAVICGPVLGRFAIDSGADAWRWIYYAPFICSFGTFAVLWLLYHPPRHPRGVEWRHAVRNLDYIGALLFVPGAVLVLMGIIYTTTLQASDLHVVVPLAVGFVFIIAFGVWETFGSCEYKLCPPEIFRANYGRSFTAPFIIAFIVTMFYYAQNVIWPTCLNVFYVTPSTTRSEELALTLPGNLGLLMGAILLSAFGNLIGRWKLTLCVSFVGAVFFGGLFALVTPFNKNTMIALVFLGQMFFGWAQYLSIAFTQFGVGKRELGVSGGLAGTARYAGGSCAGAIYATILANTQKSKMLELVPRAAIQAGLPSSSVGQLIQSLTTGSPAITNVTGIDNAIIEASSTAFKWSYAHGLKIMALTSLSFGGVGIICCLLCENIDKKMNSETAVFLENDVHGEKNEFH